MGRHDLGVIHIQQATCQQRRHFGRRSVLWVKESLNQFFFCPLHQGMSSLRRVCVVNTVFVVMIFVEAVDRVPIDGAFVVTGCITVIFYCDAVVIDVFAASLDFMIDDLEDFSGSKARFREKVVGSDLGVSE
ncbi:hypothetical protein NDU88_003437 [Pleurodeles waltl]|uniref:Transmembrane protein n=1 Tax=Pleurodeles waltl TaxID=8319 RepID=A0AAV7V015_PLEWA|nr:hypothetical protein NDU88_003437 [Pleurodeles waltl]